MPGGDNYRTEIVAAVKSCKVFMPLINDPWALSGECEDEYSLAKRLNLTSHESGRTNRNQKRVPIMIPISFSDLKWNAYPHVELLAASTNFIVHNGKSFHEGGVEQTVNRVLLSLAACGFKVSGIPQHPKPRANQGATSDAAASTKPVSVKSQIVELHGMLQSITASMQALALSPLDEGSPADSFALSRRSGKRRPTADDKEEDNDDDDDDGKKQKVEEKLGKEYLGLVHGAGSLASGEKFVYCDSMLLSLSWDCLSNSVSAKVEVHSEMKKVDGFDCAEDVPVSHSLCTWVRKEDHETATCQGSFEPETKLLKLKDLTYSGHVSNMKKYYLVLHRDRLVGVKQALRARPDLADPECTTPLNFRLVR